MKNKEHLTVTFVDFSKFWLTLSNNPLRPASSICRIQNICIIISQLQKRHPEFYTYIQTNIYTNVYIYAHMNIYTIKSHACMLINTMKEITILGIQVLTFPGSCPLWAICISMFSSIFAFSGLTRAILFTGNRKYHQNYLFTITKREINQSNQSLE